MNPNASSADLTLPASETAARRVILVGSPNVGKSVMFNNLTGRYVTVSNYPGTTVEVSRGRARVGELDVEVVDTPGLYGLLPISEEERVARRILLEERADVVVHLVDAKNLQRMLPLTLQLLELGLPVVLVLNMMDEAERHGLKIDVDGLSRWLGVPVLPAVATRGQGMDAIQAAIADPPAPTAAPTFRYDVDLEAGVREVSEALPEAERDRARGLSLLLLEDDAETLERLEASSPALRESLGRVRDRFAEDPTFRVTSRRHEVCREQLSTLVEAPRSRGRDLADRLHRILIRPVTGVPILLAVLYFGLYQFVGVFGAGVVVDFLESSIFGEWINPWVNGGLAAVLPGEGGFAYWTRELIGGEYGIITLGLTYAFAIVLPLVGTFFVFFSALEDSGYFPRLAMLVDRLFKRIGLNGRAVIPIVLGLACDTMATMVTRIQETRRERIITTFLLALAVPCSAQYGVMVGLLAAAGGAAFFGMSWAFLAWAGLIGLSFVASGWVASKAVPGTAPTFYMELPPLRWPNPLNVASKVFARMRWYFAEVLPLFVLASVLIWIGRLTGLFGLAIAGLEPVVGLLGLPAETAEVFLFGFFRRDFGAAGLFDIASGGGLSTGQLLVAAVTLTLFLPCIAQLLVMWKERGPKATVVMLVIVLVTAFAIGGLVRLLTESLGVLT